MVKNSKKGFTLIEILVVVAIIAILSSVVLIGLGPTRRAGRDARRISDLRQVQNGLELYFNHCGAYPGGASNVAGCTTGSGLTGQAGYTSMGTALVTAGAAQNVPQDPSSPNAAYRYSSTSGANYVLSTVLEDTANPALTGQAPITGYTEQCGQAGLYCVNL